MPDVEFFVFGNEEAARCGETKGDVTEEDIENQRRKMLDIVFNEPGCWKIKRHSNSRVSIKLSLKCLEPSEGFSKADPLDGPWE